MQLFATIRDRDVNSDLPQPSSYRDRKSARAVVLDPQGQIALFHSSVGQYHKLPGGGVEPGEELTQALARELWEEIGCKAEVTAELGMIEEYRNKFSLHQWSYCFLAKLLGPKGEPHMEQGEIEQGFVPVWMGIDEAIATLEDEKDVEDYQGKFIQKRDLIFLKQAKKMMGK